MKKVVILALAFSLAPIRGSLKDLPQAATDESKVPAKRGVAFKQESDQVEIFVDGRPFTTYHFRGYNKPIFFPLRAANGSIVTRGYPMIEGIPGEATDHPHHKGLWFTHGDVNGVDFWSESEKTGKIVHRKFDMVKGGSDSGILKSENDWVMPNGEIALHEVRTVTIRSAPEVRIMDFDLKLTAVGGPVKFGDTKEGSFGIRLAQPFSEKSGGRVENSRGGVGEKECWGRPAEWVDYTAKVDGETVGIAIFDHPGSFRHPTHWHARGYCLFAANPFGLHDFYNDPSKDGSYLLPKNQTIRFQYRVYIHPGTAKESNIAGAYRAYFAGTTRP